MDAPLPVKRPMQSAWVNSYVVCSLNKVERGLYVVFDELKQAAQEVIVEDPDEFRRTQPAGGKIQQSRNGTQLLSIRSIE